MITNDLDSLSEDTIFSYLNSLKRIFVIEDLPAWSPRLRSRTAIRTSDTRHFVDPSIAVAALGVGPNDLIQNLNTMGLFFESMCIRDLRVFAEALDGNIYSYRDKTGLECDAIIHLLALKNRIDSDRMKEPAFMMVLTGTGFGYRRADGVFVVPIGCLKH